jgi:osmotically-inducible protein OsmY
MGLVTQTEAKTAIEVARTTAGVTKVVTLFEFIN